MAEDHPEEEAQTVPEPPQLVYTNVLRGQGGAYDVGIEFGIQRTEDATPEFPIRVVMSWEHAKSLRAVLDGMIGGYEARVGTIPDVAGLESAIEAERSEG